MNTAASPSSIQQQPVALVTGAGRRVGNAVARFLAARGYRLALHAHSSLGAAEQTAEDLVADGVEAISVSADLRDQQATRTMVAAVHDHFGRLDALVNNAAIWSAKALEQVTPADVREHFEINTLATFVCCQEAGLIMAGQSTGGAIVNVGDWAIARPYRDHAAYFTSKGSIPTLTRTFAVELARAIHGSASTRFCPGPCCCPRDCHLRSANR